MSDPPSPRLRRAGFGFRISELKRQLPAAVRQAHHRQCGGLLGGSACNAPPSAAKLHALPSAQARRPCYNHRAQARRLCYNYRAQARRPCYNHRAQARRLCYNYRAQARRPCYTTHGRGRAGHRQDTPSPSCLGAGRADAGGSLERRTGGRSPCYAEDHRRDACATTTEHRRDACATTTEHRRDARATTAGITGETPVLHNTPVLQVEDFARIEDVVGV